MIGDHPRYPIPSGDALLDYFAACALIGIKPTGTLLGYEDYAPEHRAELIRRLTRDCWEIADAMVAERDRRLALAEAAPDPPSSWDRATDVEIAARGGASEREKRLEEALLKLCEFEDAAYVPNTAFADARAALSGTGGGA